MRLPMKKFNNPLTHLGIWIAFLTIYVLVFGYGYDDWAGTCFETAYSLSISAGVFYGTSKFSLPRLFAKRKFVLFSISLLSMLILSIFLRLLFIHFLYPGVMGREISVINKEPQALVRKFFYQWFSYSMYAVLYFGATKNLAKERNEKLEHQLAALRAQINPHFILSCLVKLRARSQKTDPELSNSIGWFTKILMSGISKPAPDGTVFLSVETDAIQGVIYMFKASFPNLQLKLNMDVDDADRFKILPHTLLPFVENAFKHGVHDDPENPIEIDLVLANSCINLSVSNIKSFEVKETSNGIGLDYVERQLKNGYPKEHSLITNETDQSYSINLSINLTAYDENKVCHCR